MRPLDIPNPPPPGGQWSESFWLSASCIPMPHATLEHRIKRAPESARMAFESLEYLLKSDAGTGAKALSPRSRRHPRWAFV